MGEFGLIFVDSEASNKRHIDISIKDDGEEVAYIFGDNIEDLDWECKHPSQCVEYDDDETVGTCALCGSWCNWHKEDIGDGNTERVPHDWYPRKNVGGLIREYIKQRYE